MLNVKHLGRIDLSTIDLRTMTPDEWDAVKREAARRAHAERAKLMRGVVKDSDPGGKITSAGATPRSRPAKGLRRDARAHISPRRKPEDAHDHQVYTAGHRCASGQAPANPIKLGASARSGSGRSGEATHTRMARGSRRSEALRPRPHAGGHCGHSRLAITTSSAVWPAKRHAGVASPCTSSLDIALGAAGRPRERLAAISV
jgi:hypothetical protein